MTHLGVPIALGSIAAAKPVFWIVMGLSLVILAWRFARSHTGWAPRITLAGALLLGFGYIFLLPLYEAGKIPPLPRGAESGAALVWYAVKTFTMNIGWLLFGLGLAIQTQVLTAAPAKSTSPSTHESAA